MRRALLRGGVVGAFVLPIDRAGEVPRRALGHGARDAHAPPRVGGGVRPQPRDRVRAQDGTRRGMRKAPQRHREHRHRDVHQPEPRGDHQQVPRLPEHRRCFGRHRRRRGPRCGAWTRRRLGENNNGATGRNCLSAKTRGSHATQLMTTQFFARDHSSSAPGAASDHGELQVHPHGDRRISARWGSVPAPRTRGGASADRVAGFDAGFDIETGPRRGERVRAPRGGGRGASPRRVRHRAGPGILPQALGGASARARGHEVVPGTGPGTRAAAIRAAQRAERRRRDGERIQRRYAPRGDRLGVSPIDAEPNQDGVEAHEGLLGERHPVTADA